MECARSKTCASWENQSRGQRGTTDVTEETDAIGSIGTHRFHPSHPRFLIQSRFTFVPRLLPGNALHSRLRLGLCTANGEHVVLSARNRATNGSDPSPGAVAPRWVAALPHGGFAGLLETRPGAGRIRELIRRQRRQSLQDEAFPGRSLGTRAKNATGDVGRLVSSRRTCRNCRLETSRPTVLRQSLTWRPRPA